MEIPKPVAVAISAVFAVVLLVGLWFGTNNNSQGQQDPPEQISAEQQRQQEDMDQYRQQHEMPR